MFIIFIFLSDLRPKGRGRPQRILLGQWPEDHVRDVIRAVVFREGDLGSNGSPPAPTSSPQHFAAPGSNQDGHHGQSQATPATVTKTEPSDHHHEASHATHPLAAESKAAQAAFEAQMKQFYNNPFASQLLAASSKMFTNIDLNPFLQSAVKIEAPEEDNFEDADNECNQDRNEPHAENDGVEDRNVPVDLVTHSHKSIDAIASKLVSNTIETSATGDGLVSAREGIKDNVFNCSDEIRKAMRTVGDKDNVPLISPCSQERKSV